MEEAEKFDPKKGAGLTFEDDVDYFEDGEWKKKIVKMTTVLEGPREVNLELGSFAGLVARASHWFATLRVRDLWAVCDDPECTANHGSNTYPEETRGFVHTVRKISEKDIIDFDMVTGERYTRVRKGRSTSIFDSKEEALKKAKEDFEEYFGEGWILMRHGDPLEE